jgi:hypothetical protein
MVDKKELNFTNAINIAKGCTDYGGGYQNKHDSEIYHHGIQTVINALEGAKKNNLTDMQSKTLHSSGKSN